MYAGTFTADGVSADNAECGTEELGNCIPEWQFTLVVGQSFHNVYHPGLAGSGCQELPDQSYGQTASQWQQQPKCDREAFVILDIAVRQQQALRGFQQHPESNNDAA